MTYKIVFSDIDGTLLNKDRQLSHLTKEVIQQLQQQVPVVLISSRMPQAMQHLQEELHISHQPIICYNGGLILVDGRSISSTEIPLQTVKALQDFNKDLQVHLSLYHSEEWYVPQMDRWATREENNTKVTPMVLSAKEVVQKWENEQKSAHKIMCMGEGENIDSIVNFLEKEYSEELHLYRSKPTYLEIANKKVSKLTAIEQLLKEHFQLPLEQAIAFGDNHNDYEMLQAAGLGIAVGNAKPEILEIAKEVTHPGHEDGVAISLKKIFRL
ncbi:MAG: HAD family hydrolase [Salinimicrobium sp.]